MELTEEKRRKKKLSVKVKVAIIGFFAVLIISVIAGSMAGSSPQSYVFTPQQGNDQALGPYVVFENISPHCYVTYLNRNNTNDHRATILFFKETEQSIQSEFPILNLTSFLHSEPTELYLYQHCGFINDRNTTLPTSFNESLGKPLPSDIQSAVFKAVQQSALTNGNFTSFAKTNSIENIQNYYFMEYSDVVSMLFQKNIMTMNSCIQDGFTPSSPEYMCEWHQSTFQYNKQTQSVDPFQILQNDTQPARGILSEIKDWT